MPLPRLAVLPLAVGTLLFGAALDRLSSVDARLAAATTLTPATVSQPAPARDHNAADPVCPDPDGARPADASRSREL